MRKRVLIAAVVAIVVAPCAYLAYTIVNNPAGSDSASTCWLATGLGDVDGDGCADLALTLRFDPTTEADAFTTWILSGREGKPLYTIRLDPSLIARRYTPEFGTHPPAWHMVHRLADLNRDGCSDIGVSCIVASDAPNPSKTVALSGKDGRILLDDLPSSSNWGAGPNFETLLDANEDGTPDLLITISGDTLHGVPPRVVIVSGADGTELQSIAAIALPAPMKGFPNRIASTYLGRDVCVVGDIDGDGIADFVVNDPEIQHTGEPYPSVFCYSTKSGRVLWTLNSEFDLASKRVQRLGWDIDSIGDVDADGIKDVLVSDQGRRPLAVSGRDGTVLPGPQMPHRITPMGDIDGDGTVDYARSFVGRVESRGQAQTEMEIVSGKAEVPLFSCRADASAEFIRACRAAGDVNGDGTADIALTGDVSMVSEGRKWKPAFGVVTIHSGTDGSVLRTIDRDALREWSARGVPSVVIR